MKLYQAFKEMEGEQVFVGHVAAHGADGVDQALPSLGEGEKYAAPVECHDPNEYRTVIEEYEDKLAREHLPERRGELRAIVNDLRTTLGNMESSVR